MGCIDTYLIARLFVCSKMAWKYVAVVRISYILVHNLVNL